MLTDQGKNIRIINLQETDEIQPGYYVPVDSVVDGTKRFDLSNITTAIEEKADASEIEGLQEEIDSKASSEEIEALEILIEGKASQDDFLETVSSLNDEISLKANQSDVEDAVRGLDDSISDLSTHVEGEIADLDTVKANKDELDITPGTGSDADKTTIQLKANTSVTVLTAHQDISGKQDVMSAETPITITDNTISISVAEYDSDDPSNSVGGSMTAEMVNILYGIDGDFREIDIRVPLPPPGPNTLRFKFSDTSYNPSDASIASAGNWVKQETGENVWDWTNNNVSWSSCFRSAFTDSNNSVDVIAAGDTSGVTNMAQLFDGCIALRSVALFDTGNATSVYGMFRNCSSLVSIPDLNTSNARNFTSMMEGCTSLAALPSLDTTLASNLTSMCSGCVNIETGILTLYNQLRASANISSTNHFNVFTSCGTNTASGTAEWSQVLCTWGGGYTPTSVTIEGKTYGVTQVSKYLVMTENLACSGGKWYDNDEATYSAKGYGKLYTWNEISAMTFPDEWRLPNYTDMQLLTKNLTASDWKSTSGWKDGGNGTNSTGLNMLPAGYGRTGSATNGFFGETEAARIWYKYNDTGYYITLYYDNNAFDWNSSGGYTHHLSARLILQIRS